MSSSDALRRSPTPAAANDTGPLPPQTQTTPRFVLSRPLVASAVIGATSRAQLEELLAAAAAPPLEAGVLREIDEVHAALPNPTP